MRLFIATLVAVLILGRAEAQTLLPTWSAPSGLMDTNGQPIPPGAIIIGPPLMSMIGPNDPVLQGGDSISICARLGLFRRESYSSYNFSGPGFRQSYSSYNFNGPFQQRSYSSYDFNGFEPQWTPQPQFAQYAPQQQYAPSQQYAPQQQYQPQQQYAPQQQAPACCAASAYSSSGRR